MIRSQYLMFVLFVVTSVSYGDKVEKWIDEKGRIYYGNAPAGIEVKPLDKVEIQDTFDETEYKKAVDRNKETEQVLDEYEKERKEEAERTAKEEAERKARIKQPPPLAGPQINLPPPEYPAPEVPGRPWLGVPIPPEPTPLPTVE